MRRYSEPKSSKESHYPIKDLSRRGVRNPSDLSNLCRPGFIIIGAGKCGTSSLYHYLVGHPRVLPAVQKQIHYWVYHRDREFI